VQSTTPENLEEGVALNKSIAVTFSEAISPETLTEAAFLLRQADGSPVQSRVSVTGATATLKPVSNSGLLKGGTSFIATVTTRVRDLSGNPIDQDHVWRFSTAEAGSPGSIDEQSPGILPSALNPPDGARGVTLRPTILLTFDEEIDPASVVPGHNFSLNHGAKGTLSFPGDGKTVIFTPTRDLDPGRRYKVQVLGGAGGIKDLAGNALASSYTWSFRTRSESTGDF